MFDHCSNIVDEHNLTQSCRRQHHNLDDLHKEASTFGQRLADDKNEAQKKM